MEVKTPNSEEYIFFPVQTFRKSIAIKTGHDAHVSFTSAEGETTPMVEIILGGWKNTKSVIRFNREKPDKVEVATPDILSAEEHRDFTFEWTPSGSLFQVYRGMDTEPFISWRNLEQRFPVTHFGVRTCWESTGEWICDGVNYIGTSDSMVYNYNPVEAVGGHVEFQVRASNDASVCLTTEESDIGGPIHEIILGGWENTKCAIRHNREIPHAFEIEIPSILNNEEYKSFSIDWNYGEIKVRVGHAPDAFMEWTSRVAHPVSFFGIRTAYGSEGSWIIPCEGSCVVTEEVVFGGGSDPDRIRRGVDDISIGGGAVPQIPTGGFDWVASSGGFIPDDAVRGGDDGGEPIFVGRARHESDLLPGKLVPSHGVVYVPYGGGEHGKENYEVLVAPAPSVAWIAANGGTVPDNAIPGGETEFQETLYIGRHMHEGSLTIGKIHPSHGNLYISYGGQEIGYEEYEVLVRK